MFESKTKIVIIEQWYVWGKCHFRLITENGFFKMVVKIQLKNVKKRRLKFGSKSAINVPYFYTRLYKHMEYTRVRFMRLQVFYHISNIIFNICGEICWL